MERISLLFEVSLSKKFIIFSLICICLPLTILQHVHSSTMEETIAESQEIFDGLNRDLRNRRSLEGFQYRTINSAPCSTSGMFLNEKRKNGRWYWYCYLDESGRLSWMTMRCPNKRLFDPLIQKCVTNLTSTTEAPTTITGSVTTQTSPTGTSGSSNVPTGTSPIGPTSPSLLTTLSPGSTELPSTTELSSTTELPSTIQLPSTT